MVFKNSKVYDFIKYFCLVVSPALCTLIVGLGVLYGFNSEIIVGTITLITTFIGALVGISSSAYKKQENENNDENGAA